MADKNCRWESNATGKYYVDQACIASKFCVAAAPANFRMSEAGYAHVIRQPETADEEDACRQAVAGCPVNAVGDDGQ